MSITITKLPDSVDPNVLIEQEVKRRYGSKCPCCGETRRSFDCLIDGKSNAGIDVGIICDSWYGKHDADEHFFAFFRFWEKSYHYEKLRGHCHTCGAKWNLPAYPTNVLTQKEVNEVYKRLFGEGTQ